MRKKFGMCPNGMVIPADPGSNPGNPTILIRGGLMETVYFDSGGKQHTEKCLEIAKQHVDKERIKSIVVASTYGYTAEKAAEVFKNRNLVIVTHVAGFAKENEQQFPKDLRERLEAKGVKIVTAAHAFGGINRAIEGSPGDIVADTLRMLSQGVKVAVEIVLEAADAGLISTKEDVIAIAGTGKGADTVLVVKPANSKNLFDLRVKKILAKPL